MKHHPKQTAFMAQMDAVGAMHLLFDSLAGVSFFAKTKQFELIFANHSFLERIGMQQEIDIVGKTDFELFPKAMADNFRKDDTWVVDHGKPKLQIIELFIHSDGLPDWYMTNKLPIFGKNKEVIGIMGTTQSYQSGKKFVRPYMQIEPAVEYIQAHFRRKVTIDEVARTVSLSARQLDRKFQETIKMSPRDFIMKLRVRAACQALTQGDDKIMDIAQNLGFYDQSSFTLHFRKQMGTTPLKYRKHHQDAAD